jgi:hypothetical protein
MEVDPVGTDAPTLLLANHSTSTRPVGYGASLLLCIRKITLFGKWPTLLDNRQRSQQPIGTIRSTLLTHCQRITVSDLWVTALPGLSELPKREGSSAE